MSRTRTIDPSDLARTTMSANCSGVLSRPSVVTGSVSSVPGGAGSRPRRPAGLVAFCSRTASATSPVVMASCAIRSGSSWISIENSSATEGDGVADAGDALDLVLDVQLHVVREIGGVVPGIVGREGHHAEDVGVGLEDRDPVLPNRVGQLRLRELDRVLHVHRREILAPGHVEVDLQAHGPVARVGRRVVEQALETGKLRLDRRGDGLGHILGRRAGEGRLDRHRRRGDLRVARDRQQPDGEHAQQRDDDADDDGQDRAADEEVADFAIRPAGRGPCGTAHFVPPTFAVSSGAAATLSASGTGCTGRPAATFCTPSTTTRSPGFRPLSMIQRLPLHWPG